MTQFVNDDTSLEISITIRVGCAPEVHSATTILTIRWRHKVGVVVTATVLGISNDSVVLSTSTTEIVLLEVPRNFIETVSKNPISSQHYFRDDQEGIPVIQIVNHVGGIEKLRHSSIDVFLSFVKPVGTVLCLGRVGVIKDQVGSSFWTVVVDPIVPTFPILVSKDLTYEQ